jgi:uncharacterized UPF0146 family protein
MNIQEQITKFTNLSENDSLSAFQGHTAQQSHFAYEVFYNFIKEIKPKRILEIGTALGGFTEFLFIIINELGLDTQILSYDISERPWYSQMIDKGINIKVENIFSPNWDSVNPEVEEYIKGDGITIVLCDGGWKIGEFKLLSTYLKNDDFILAHDYAENKVTFEEKIQNKIWNWHEIQDSDISESCIKNNLELYNKETFEGAAWTCRIKK